MPRRNKDDYTTYHPLISSWPFNPYLINLRHHIKWTLFNTSKGNSTAASSSELLIEDTARELQKKTAKIHSITTS